MGVGGQLQHKPEGDFSSCIESCFPLTDNVSLGDATANSLHVKKSLPPSLSIAVALCVDRSLSLSLPPSLSINGVRILENFVAQDKSRGAESHGIRNPPYHPDDPECQLPSTALQGVACHSRCSPCVSGIEEALRVCHWRSEKLQYITARCWTAVGQLITHYQNAQRCNHTH